MTTVTDEYRLTVRSAGKTYNLDFHQAFYFGYAMAKTRKLQGSVTDV